MQYLSSLKATINKTKIVKLTKVVNAGGFTAKSFARAVQDEGRVGTRSAIQMNNGREPAAVIELIRLTVDRIASTLPGLNFDELVNPKIEKYLVSNYAGKVRNPEQINKIVADLAALGKVLSEAQNALSRQGSSDRKPDPEETENLSPTTQNSNVTSNIEHVETFESTGDVTITPSASTVDISQRLRGTEYLRPFSQE